MLLPENGEHFVLIHHRLELLRMFWVGKAQEDTVVVRNEVEERELAGVNEQRTIEIVRCFAQCVVMGIE